MAAIALLVWPAPSAAASEPQVLAVDMPSDVLSAFWGQPISIKGDVLLPDSYYKKPAKRYPSLYVVHAFLGSSNIDGSTVARWQHAQRATNSEFIMFFLDANINGGHHEFADSQNYGPWGTALATEFIPRTDQNFRTIAEPKARFVTGHSSGGWSALWLEISYPKLFGGEWSVSPDPVDFHDFTGPDLTLMRPANFYRDSLGRDYVDRDGTKLRDLVQKIPWGIRQFDSFEEVFSPSGRDGKAKKLFNRETGEIDPVVAQYWERHWDIAATLRAQWPAIGPQLHGKIHVFVGTKDNFDLDVPVHRLDSELTSLDATAEFGYARDADHWSVFGYHGDLYTDIISEMSASLSGGRSTGSR